MVQKQQQAELAVMTEQHRLELQELTNFYEERLEGFESSEAQQIQRMGQLQVRRQKVSPFVVLSLS